MNQNRIQKVLVIISLLFFMGFTNRGCDFFNKIFSLVNFGTNTYYNAVTDGFFYFYYASNEGKIYRHSGEFEEPWELHFTAPGNPDLLDIAHDLLKVVCVGKNGTILKLENDKAQWEVKNINVTVQLNKLFLGIFDYYAVGDSGTVLKSTNFGDNWQQLNFPVSNNLYDITENRGVIFVSGDNYCFYKSSDKGETWMPTGPGDIPALGPSSNYNRIYFFNDSIGYVGGPNGLILKTFDGGLTWGTRVASDFEEINDLYFVSPDSGAAVGPNGIVRLTTDGGNTWFEDEMLTTYLNGETIKRIFPFGKNHGFVVGDNGFDIFVAKDSTYLDSLRIPTSVENSLEIPDKFLLKQNYPNPFNPTTKIEFQLKETGYTTLRVYDLLGKEISTLVDEELYPGNYKFSFDASELSSGIYFYQLSSGNFVETKKLILLR